MAKHVGNADLHKAGKAKKDEFYTQLTDIEKEMCHYRDYFRGKTIFCNCDDPDWSNFWKYFELNFEELGIKKLISTHFEREQPSYKLELIADIDTEGKITSKKIIRTPLQQNGDFRSPECVELLQEADTIVTNPPFSLFREYIAQLMEYNKKFIIIGNINALTYKEVFPLIKENKVWLGASIHSGDRKFDVPDTYPLEASNCGIDENGKRFIRVKGVRWFTNIDYEERHEKMILYKHYDPEEYPKYDNYNAIEVKKTADIPCDYDFLMGVPITYIDHHNEDQFEIVGITLGNTVDYPMTRIYENAIQHNKNGTTQNGSKVNTRAAIKKSQMPSDTVFYTASNTEGYLVSIYPRILIRRKKANDED